MPIIIKVLSQPESIFVGVFFVLMVIFLNYVAGYDRDAQMAKRNREPKKPKPKPAPPPAEAEEEEDSEK